jgi:hypothetical protein
MADVNCSTSITVVPPCPPACAEVFPAECIVYTGRDLSCTDGTVVIKRYDYLDTIITKLVEYVCTNAVAGPQGPQGVQGLPGPQGPPGTGSDVTLTSSGGNISLVTDGNGPALAIRGLSGGYGITVSSASGAAIITAECPLQVEIIPGGEIRSIQAVVTGGVGPYTYSWKMADMIGGVLNSMWLLTSTLNPAIVTAVLNPAVVNKFDSCASANAGSVGLAKVIVTDSNGCIAKDTHLLIEILCA